MKEKGRTAIAARKAQAQVDKELSAMYGLRAPKEPSAFQAFALELPEDQQPFAKVFWQMQCLHDYETVVGLADGTPVDQRCKVCDRLDKYQSTEGKMKRAEWRSYCPDGFDMFDWADLYTSDKTLWGDIFDEVLFEMSEEVANG